MYTRKTKLLNHGYSEYIEHWGSDERVIESARMSVSKGFISWDEIICPFCVHGNRVKTKKIIKSSWDSLIIDIKKEDDCVYIQSLLPNREETNFVIMCPDCNGSALYPGDKRLLSYLMKNQHTTPFEMCGLTFEICAPIFVFRQWHRHRTLSYNEMSGRYTALPDYNYIPDISRLVKKDTKNKQQKGINNKILTDQEKEDWLNKVTSLNILLEEFYQHSLELGIDKELARICLPVARYSKMRVSGNLLNWLKFCRLRSADDAQEEIRVYSLEIENVIKDLFPRVYEVYISNKSK